MLLLLLLQLLLLLLLLLIPPVLLYRRLGGVIGVSRPLTGKSFRFVRACDAKLCVSARRMRFRLLGLPADLQRRRRGGVPVPWPPFGSKTAPLLNEIVIFG